jgi:hypothetical protein
MQSFGLRRRAVAPLVCLAALACSSKKSGDEPAGPSSGVGGAPTGAGGTVSPGQGGGAGSGAATPAPVGGNVGNQGGTTATNGGNQAQGGTLASSTGGRLTFASAGRGGAIVLLPPDDPGAGGAATVCSSLQVVPGIPTVLILVDNSSSMFEPIDDSPWKLLYSTLMADDGAIKSLAPKVRFGFTSYKGNATAQMDETDPACATLTSVPIALDNFAAIDKTYTTLGAEWMPGIKWETPTGHALARAATDLAAFKGDPPGPKSILLVTDGNPNTCQIVDPQCGQDLSIKAVQDAFTAGIKTFVVGIGEVIEGNVGCEPEWGRCGPDHLQDIANAGLGLPVEPPPETFIWQSCADRYGRVLQGTYDTTAMPGTAKFYTAENAAQLTTAIEELLTALACTVEMDVRVTGNPALGSVLVGTAKEPQVYGDANGWKLEDNRYQVTLQGAACEKFKAEQTLDINFPCDPLTGMPVAVKR